MAVGVAWKDLAALNADWIVGEAKGTRTSVGEVEVRRGGVLQGFSRPSGRGEGGGQTLG